MAQFENKQKISTIVFKPKSACHNLCPLGQLYCDELAKDGSKPILPHYTNNFTIEFWPNKIIFDYIDIEKWITRNLNDETLVIEDCVAMLFDYIKKTYEPKVLRVTSEVNDALHGPVVVTKSSAFLEV